MYQLFATLHTLGIRASTRLSQLSERLREDPERGSVTIEQVVWAVAVIAIAAIVVTAIKAYVTTQSSLIK
jgi:hypothetical protein